MIFTMMHNPTTDKYFCNNKKVLFEVFNRVVINKSGEIVYRFHDMIDAHNHSHLWEDKPDLMYVIEIPPLYFKVVEDESLQISTLPKDGFNLHQAFTLKQNTFRPDNLMIPIKPSEKSCQYIKDPVYNPYVRGFLEQLTWLSELDEKVWGERLD